MWIIKVDRIVEIILTVEDFSQILLVSQNLE